MSARSSLVLLLSFCLLHTAILANETQPLKTFEDRLLAFCFGVLGTWHAMGENDVSYAGVAHSGSGGNAWYKKWRGVNIPIVAGDGLWDFSFGRRGFSLRRDDGFAVSMQISHLAEARKGIDSLARQFGIPVSQLDTLRLLDLALEQSEAPHCDVSRPEASIDRMYGLFLKSLVVEPNSQAYRGQGRGITFRESGGNGERWRYLAWDSGETEYIEVQLFPGPTAPPDFGYLIGGTTYTIETPEPQWLDALFDAGNSPSPATLIALMEVATNEDVTKGTLEMLEHYYRELPPNIALERTR